jgi:hypothetical protein
MRTFLTNSFKCELGDYNSICNALSNKINIIVNSALEDYYNTYKINPYVSSMKITIDDYQFIVNWEVIIEESPDGKAYIGLTSTGASGKFDGVDGSINRAFEKIKSKKKKLPFEISKKTEIADIVDFNFKSKTEGFGIRQIFVIYTNPDIYPYLPKKENKDFIVGKIFGATPQTIHNNGQLISSLDSGDTRAEIINSLFKKNRSN